MLVVPDVQRSDSGADGRSAVAPFFRCWISADCVDIYNKVETTHAVLQTHIVNACVMHDLTPRCGPSFPYNLVWNNCWHENCK